MSRQSFFFFFSFFPFNRLNQRFTLDMFTAKIRRNSDINREFIQEVARKILSDEDQGKRACLPLDPLERSDSTDR